MWQQKDLGTTGHQGQLIQLAITLIKVIEFLCSKPKSTYFSILFTMTFRIRSLIVLTCRRTLQKSGKDHTILLVLPCGIYHYKFIVDGNVKYIPDLPYEADEMGNVVNLLDVCVSNISNCQLLLLVDEISSVLFYLFYSYFPFFKKEWPRLGIIMPFVFIFMDGKL